MSYLELRDISKTYGEGAAEVDALDDIDFSVDGGHLVAVMGPSGSIMPSRSSRCRVVYTCPTLSGHTSPVLDSNS